MKSAVRERTEAPARPTRTLPRATEQHAQVSKGSHRNQEPRLDKGEGSWRGCDSYFDGCSCPRCAEAEQRGYLNDTDSEEGRRYAQLCEVLEVAPVMRHSRHYWELKLQAIAKSLSGGNEDGG